MQIASKHHIFRNKVWHYAEIIVILLPKPKTFFMRKSIILTILTAMSVASYAQTDRATTLQGARTLVVTDSQGQRDYQRVTTAKPFVIKLKDGQLAFPDKVMNISDVDNMRVEVPQKFMLNEDSTTFTPYNVDHGLLALRRSLQVNKWNSLVVPVSLSGRQIADAFGEGTLLAAYQDIIEGETEAQVNFHTISLDTDAEVIEPNVHYLIRPTREPDIAIGKTSTVNYGTARVPGPAYLVADASMDAANKTPQYKTVQSDQKNVRLRLTGTYTLRDDKQKVPNVFYLNDEGNFAMQTDSVAIKAFSSWIIQARNTNEIAINFYVDGISMTGDITGIAEKPQTSNLKSQTIYDLQGRRIATPQKRGIYIINGKKVFVR